MVSSLSRILIATVEPKGTFINSSNTGNSAFPFLAFSPYPPTISLINSLASFFTLIVLISDK